MSEVKWPQSMPRFTRTSAEKQEGPCVCVCVCGERDGSNRTKRVCVCVCVCVCVWMVRGMGATGPSALPPGTESHLSARASWASEESQSPCRAH